LSRSINLKLRRSEISDAAPPELADEGETIEVSGGMLML
jgi:hypothetical protein